MNMQYGQPAWGKTTASATKARLENVLAATSFDVVDAEKAAKAMIAVAPDSGARLGIERLLSAIRKLRTRKPMPAEQRSLRNSCSRLRVEESPVACRPNRKG
jgi:hypothetical protein